MQAKNGTLEKANPVILLFDNEQIDSKPLNKFLTTTNLSLNDNKLSKHIVGNLFLLTIPLINNLKECEIEDLYEKDLLNTTINGKTFDKNGENNSEKYFGKYIFANHVKKYYKKINFNEFIPLLDSLNELC